MLFWRFRRLVCTEPLAAGNFRFGNWLVSCKPGTFVCLEIRHIEHGRTRYKLSLSTKGSATFTNAAGKGFLLCS
eukprot:SAG22_NODE_179_length_16124_cov_7.355445_14_plen_74_part_00